MFTKMMVSLVEIKYTTQSGINLKNIINALDDDGPQQMGNPDI